MTYLFAFQQVFALALVGKMVCFSQVIKSDFIILFSRTSKGFSSQQTIKQNGCVEVYTETLKVFLGALGVPVQRPILHQGVRQFLHRMVVCLEADILPFIPVAMDNLLKYADIRQMHDFIPFINQVVQKFKVLVIK